MNEMLGMRDDDYCEDTPSVDTPSVDTPSVDTSSVDTSSEDTPSEDTPVDMEIDTVKDDKIIEWNTHSKVRKAMD